MWTTCVVSLASCTRAPSGATPSGKRAAATSHTRREKKSDRDEPAPGVADKASAKSAKHATGTHIGEIPKDAWPEIFFDDPLNVAAEGRPVTPPTPERPIATVPAHVPPTTDGSPNSRTSDDKNSSRSADWSTFLSGDELADEAKAIKASLNDKLQSVGKYNGNYKEVRNDAATLAVLAAIAIEHPDAPGWKRQARHVRDVSAEIVAAAAGLGDKSYKPTRAAFDKLDALLEGSTPPGLEESSDTLPVSELVSRVPLMYRMERAFNWMKLSVNTEAVFKKESVRVAHEGALLATLAKVIAEPGFSDADNDEYLGFARELSNAGQQAVEAARAGNFGNYTASLDRAGKACTDCHANFKNN